MEETASLAQNASSLRTQAQTAMGGGKVVGELNGTDLTTARAYASQSMEGAELRKERLLAHIQEQKEQKWQTAGSIAEKKDAASIVFARARQMASAAMEGPERKKARLAREAEERAREENTAKVKAENERRAKLKSEEKARLERLLADSRERERQKIETQKTTVNELATNADLSIHSLRTLKEDMGAAIKGEKMSLVSMAIKESERKRKEVEELGRDTHSLRSARLLSLILLLSGVTIVSYASYRVFSKQSSTPPNSSGQLPAPASLIFSDSSKTVAVANMNDVQITNILKNEVNNLNTPLGSLEEVRLPIQTTDAANLPLASFLNLLDAHAPDLLVRNVKSQFMYGVYSSQVNAGFLAVPVAAYDRAFAGMLQWEPTLVRDLKVVLSGKAPTDDVLSAHFNDAVLKNTDVRESKDSAGNVVLIYSFFNRETLIITSTEASFVELLNRLTTPRPVVQ